MRIGSIGYNYQHKEVFVMDYPQGIGCHLLLLIKEPSVFYLNEQMIEVEKNSFVLIAPETPCRNRTLLHQLWNKGHCTKMRVFQ